MSQIVPAKINDPCSLLRSTKSHLEVPDRFADLVADTPSDTVGVTSASCPPILPQPGRSPRNRGHFTLIGNAEPPRTQERPSRSLLSHRPFSINGRSTTILPNNGWSIESNQRLVPRRPPDRTALAPSTRSPMAQQSCDELCGRANSQPLCLEASGTS